VSLEVDAVMRVLRACDERLERNTVPLISLIFPKSGGGHGQVFLPWTGRMLKDYIGHPALTNKLSLYQAAYSRILDHNGVKRRLTYSPKAGDEIRFIKVSPIGGVK
jgi:hypothetical protein